MSQADNSRHFFQQIFEKHESVMLLIHPRHGQIIRANQAAVRFYGYSQSELENMRVSDINILSPAEIQAEMERARTEQQNAFVFTHRLANGNLRTVEVHSTPIPMEEHTLLFSVIHDITQRQQAEAALQASEARYHQIVELAEEGIWIIDEDDTTRFANRKMAEMLGYQHPDELIGQPMYAFMPPEEEVFARNNVKRRREGVHEIHDFLLQRKDGSTLWTSMSTSPIFGETGDYQGAMAMVTNISERKRWEDELQSTLEERESLLQELHHRVKNNFQVMISLLRLQERRLSPTDTTHGQNPLKAARQRIRTMALIHEQIYHAHDLGSIDASIYLKQIFRELYGQAELAIPIAIEQQLESVRLPLEQALACGLLCHELISNALRFAFPGPQASAPRLWLHLRQNASHVILEIGDNGIGLTTHIQAQAQHFGLHLVQQLCQQLGARLEESGPPGTCWKISFAQPRRL
ncbi:MAG: PAS domain S-box protein [Candidatus Sericytochromatia bacterium]|nr:PAS domain S-box protein [Candidatus Sericytochromatia bacterium]